MPQNGTATLDDIQDQPASGTATLDDIATEAPQAPASPSPFKPSPSFLQRAGHLASGLVPDFQRQPGTRYEAAPGSGSPEAQQVRLGNMVPEAAVPALTLANKYAVEPFNRI